VTFKAGAAWTGNKSGRPKKGESITEVIRLHGNEKNKAALAAKMWAMALSGNETMIKYLCDRLEGSPKQIQEISGPEGESLFMPVEEARETLKLIRGRKSG
jgi:hypothetical protein